MSEFPKQPTKSRACTQFLCYNAGIYFLLHDHFTGCPLAEIWIQSSSNLPDVRSLNDTAARYPSCDNSSVGSAVLENTTLNTATVAYYNGTTPGSRACYVCDEDNQYELNSTITVRVCQNNGLWSGSPIICGMLCICDVLHTIVIYLME